MLTLIAKLGGTTAFNPETVRIMVDAFDHAWASLQASGAPFSTDEYAERAREFIAKCIIEAAKSGERDQRTLTEGALLELTKLDLKRFRKPQLRPIKRDSRGPPARSS